jgi:hypothetical protein
MMNWRQAIFFVAHGNEIVKAKMRIKTDYAAEKMRMLVG